jgi:hypothetical protein
VKAQRSGYFVDNDDFPGRAEMSSLQELHSPTLPCIDAWNELGFVLLEIFQK